MHASTNSGSRLRVLAGCDGQIPGVHQRVHERPRARLGHRPLEPQRRPAPLIQHARSLQRIQHPHGTPAR